MASSFLKDFTTRYMDPTEVYGGFEKLAAEFPNIAELITLPNKTNGYQRRAQAHMSGAFPTGTTPSSTRSAQEGAVVLTSRAWGHEGGNNITAEFRNPGAPNSPLTVTMVDNDLVVMLGHERAGQLDEHGGAGRRRDQRQPGGEPEAGRERSSRA